MFRIADYLIRFQKDPPDAGHAVLIPLDTRGHKGPLASAPILAKAMLKIAAGRISGRLVGVHVNMAERLSVFRKCTLIVWCRLLGLPVVLHVHAAQLHLFYRTLPAPLKSLTRRVLSLPALCIVLGEEGRRFIIEEVGCDPSKVAIVHNGVPDSTLMVRGQDSPVTSSREMSTTFLFLGNLEERKGLSDLLHALARIESGSDPTIKLVVSGEGDVEHYQALANRLGLGARVRFTGWIDRDEVSSLMRHADALVLPSYDEGLPLAILEAFAKSVPVICTPVGEIPGLLQDDVHACFVPPGDVVKLANALLRVSSDPALRRRLGSNGRALYERQFSMKQFFDRIAQIHLQAFGISPSAAAK